MFHKYKGHDIKNYMSYKLAQEFYNSKGKDTNFTSKKAFSNPKVLIYSKAYIIIKLIISTFLSK
jgi:hypothetical protein